MPSSGLINGHLDPVFPAGWQSQTKEHNNLLTLEVRVWDGGSDNSPIT
jgi:hypothetical protein